VQAAAGSGLCLCDKGSGVRKLIWLVGILGLFYGYYRYDTRWNTVRHKVVVEVETPQGLKSGFSVSETRTRKLWLSLSGNKYVSRERGEAVAVDLPDNQTLFALIGQNENTYDLSELIGRTLYPHGSAYEVGRRSVNDPPVAFVRRFPYGGSGLPLLVTFRDMSDPKSVVRVDPDDLAASFGAGVRLKRITVQVTDDPVTTGIEKRLGWWKDHINRHFDGSSTIIEDMRTQDLKAHMSSGSFSTEFNK
jgi:hypothetical protein